MDYMLQNGSTDLYTPFLALESAAETMVCAPGRAIQAIAGLHPLYLKILRLCRDGVLPREMMQTALCNLDNRMGIFRSRYFGRKGRIPDGRPTGVVAQAIFDAIQYGANILRDLKTKESMYIRSMKWVRDVHLIDELIDTITFANSPETEAMDVAHQHSNVDDTGCRMDVFDRVLSGALGRPWQPDIPVPQWKVWPWKDPALGTQTPAGDAGSVGTDEAVELERAGVDTAHRHGPLIAKTGLPGKPKRRQPRRNGKRISSKASSTTTAVDQLPVSSGLRQDGSPPETSDKKSPVPGVVSSGYRKLVDRIRKYRAMECDVGRDIESQRRKYCEAAYKARLTRMTSSGGGTVVEQLAGHRKAARKSFVKAGREFDRVVSGI
jgi:hypothetical protein